MLGHSKVAPERDVLFNNFGGTSPVVGDVVGGVAVDASFDFMITRESLYLASVTIVLVFCVRFVSTNAAGGGVLAGRGVMSWGESALI